MKCDDHSAGDEECERHSRLMGLWFICFIVLTMGMINLGSLLRATPLGLIILAPVTCLELAVGVGLWQRKSWAFWTLLVIHVLIVVGWGVSFARNLSSSPVLAMFFALGVVFGLSVVMYLFMRKGHFRRGIPKPGLRSKLFIGTAGGAILLGGSIAALLFVDQGPDNFPRLQLDRTPPPPERNGYIVLSEMEDEGLCSHRRSMEVASDIPEPSTEEFRNWTQEAEEVINADRGCLRKLKEALSRDRLLIDEPVKYGMYLGVSPALMRRIGGLLRIRTVLALAEDRPARAVLASRDAVELGLRYASAKGEFMDFLAGRNLWTDGLSCWKRCAESPAVSSELLQKGVRSLTMERRLRRGWGDSMRVEYAATKWMIRKFGALEKVPGWKVNLQEQAGWNRKLFRDPNPLLKENHTINLVGRRYSKLLEMAKRGKFTVEHRMQGGVFGRGHGALQWVRNPLGVILAGMVLSREEMRTYFDALCRLRATKLVLELGIYRRQTGRLPEKLGSLSDDGEEKGRRDPFSGKAFLYEKEGAVARVISVGPDGRRDPEGEPQRKRDDIVLQADYGQVFGP